MDRDMPGVVRWRLRTADAWQRVAAGSPYWHDNRRRGGGAVIVQYTRAGALTLRRGGIRLRVPPGSAALLRFGAAEAYGLDPADGEGYDCAYVSLQGAGLPEHWRELVDLHGPVVAYGPGLLADLLALMQACAAGPSGQAGLIHAFVMRLYQGPPPGEATATERAIAAIRADPCAVRSLKELAAAHGIAREHLARAFRARVGVPAWSFVTAARLARARDLLADTTLAVADVARLCGYASARVLARNLADASGRPPSAWRHPLARRV